MSPLKLVLLFALIAGPVAAKTAPACPDGLHPAKTAELFFGRNVGQEVGVSEDDWRAFLTTEVSPRFPDGLSVIDVYGQWRDRGGQFVREPTKAVILVMAGTREEGAKLTAIRDAYKHRFSQDSVLLIEHPACVSF